MKCLRPVPIRNPVYYKDKLLHPDSTFFMLVPCGKCINCLKRKIQETYTRLWLQSRDSFFSSFVCPTYSDDNLPEYGVNKADLQKYFKRMRKNYYFTQFAPLKYFAISEYGPNNTHRPHYHIMMYNAPDNIIRDNWHFGICHTLPVIPERIMYVAKYHVLKNLFVPEGKNENFRLSSQGLGLDGFNHFEYDNAVSNEWKFLYDDNGFKRVLPRYYRKIYDITFPPEIVFDNPYNHLSKRQIHDLNNAIDAKTDLFIKRLMLNKQFL